jgi:hypothetical protein
MDRLVSANVARVVARMDAIAAAQAHPIAVTDSVHWRFPLFWVTSPMGAGLDLSIGVIGTGASLFVAAMMALVHQQGLPCLFSRFCSAKGLRNRQRWTQ